MTNSKGECIHCGVRLGTSTAGHGIGKCVEEHTQKEKSLTLAEVEKMLNKLKRELNMKRFEVRDQCPETESVLMLDIKHAIKEIKSSLRP